MHRPLLPVVTTILALAALVALPWLGWTEAKRQAYASTAEVATSYARDILYRTDKTGTQALDTMARLQAARLAPCSAAELTMMEQADISLSYIQAVGRMRDGRVQCSSIGALALDLGAESYRTPKDVVLYFNVRVGQTADRSVLALQQGDFVVFVHRELPLDTWIGAGDVSLGILQIDRSINSVPDIARGDVSRAWLTRLAGKNETTFVEGGRIIAVVRSTLFRVAAVTALPPGEFVIRRNAIAMRLVPAGVFFGLIMALAILYVARRQGSMAAALRTALRRQEFHMQYQPIIALASGQCIGAEALIRWRRPDGELIGPDLFIPIAEQSGLITRITERVLELVQTDAGAWLAAHPDFHIAVNLSPADLQSPVLVDALDRFMRASGAQPANLVLELTERGIIDIDTARPVMHALHARGYDFAIDDFGTGYSSLSYLESLELDILKIDRSFVTAIGTRAPTSQVVSHIIAMASAMGLRMIAEGVEQQAQADYLHAHGVQYAQGWLFGRPGAFGAIAARVDDATGAALTPSSGTPAGRIATVHS